MRLRVSYRELNGMANSLAREIVLRYASVTGAEPLADSPIALYSEKAWKWSWRCWRC